jgi:hypothetical protein
MAPSKGGVIRKHFELGCPPEGVLYAAIARKVGVPKSLRQGRLVADLVFYPPKGAKRAAKKR